MSGVSSPISRKPFSPTPPLTLIARTVHPRHRSTAILPSLLAQSHNLVVTLRRQHTNQSHHPLHVPTPSRTQPARFRLLHHRVHCHRRTFHERILRKSRHRIRIAANIRLPHLHFAHLLHGGLQRRRLRCHRAVRSRLRECRSNTHPAPHAWTIFRRRRRTSAHNPHALLHPRAARHPRAGRHSLAPRHRPGHGRHLIHHVMWHMAVNHPVARIRCHKFHVARLRHSHQHRVVRPPSSSRLPPSFRPGNYKLVPMHVNRMMIHPQINKSQPHAIAQPHNQRSTRGSRLSVQRQPIEFHAHRVRRGIIRQH